MPEGGRAVDGSYAKRAATGGAISRKTHANQRAADLITASFVLEGRQRGSLDDNGPSALVCVRVYRGPNALGRGQPREWPQAGRAP
jgi:hypothetical protein